MNALLVRPVSGAGPVVLRVPTSDAWLPCALRNFDAVLLDHAHCEKKAAANALSLLQSYPDLPGLPSQMARLAREESAHLAKVLELMEGRGLSLNKDTGDGYAQQLQKHVRTPSLERRLDRLLVAAIIEARSCERLALLASGLAAEDTALAHFYRELAQSEDGHQALFFRLAEQASGPKAAQARLEVLLDTEAELLSRLPVLPRIH